MQYIDFGAPDSVDKIEKLGAFYKASFELAEVYGLINPAAFLTDVKSSARYNLSDLLERQNAEPVKKSDVSQGKKKDDVIIEDVDDKPIDLDNIPF